MRVFPVASLYFFEVTIFEHFFQVRRLFWFLKYLGMGHKILCFVCCRLSPRIKNTVFFHQKYYFMPIGKTGSLIYVEIHTRR